MSFSGWNYFFVRLIVSDNETGDFLSFLFFFKNHVKSHFKG